MDLKRCMTNVPVQFSEETGAGDTSLLVLYIQGLLQYEKHPSMTETRADRAGECEKHQQLV